MIFSLFLCTGTTFAFFHTEGNVPLSRQDLKLNSKGGKVESPHNFSIHILIMSCPWALSGSRLFIILAISALVIGIDESVLIVFMLSLAGISIALSIKVHCWDKKLLNTSTLSLKFEMNLLLWNSGGMQGIFLLIRNVLKSDQ